MNAPLEATPAAHAIRTFMAAAVSEAVRHALAGIQSRLQPAGADIGWVEPARIHLTLLFLGHVFEPQATALAAATDDITADYKPCTLEVKGLGCFGRPHAPRVVWAGLTGNLQPLLELQGEIAEAAKAAGIYTDARPFHPHLTIGRVLSSRRAQELLQALETCRGTAFGTLAIKSVHLMQSELTPQGPIYTRLHESRLAAAD